jgi:hypothetical protein
MKRLRFQHGLVAGLVAGAWAQSSACDLCAVYSAQEASGQAGRGVVAGVAEQFTHFGTMQFDGQEVPNEAGQFLDSSVSQLFVGYNFTGRIGLQFNLPVIDRSFMRPEGFNLDRGTEAGIGDAALVGNASLFRRNRENSTLAWNVIGGVKFPTGSTGRLQEEFNEEATPGAPESGIHGHDLTLGSGSFDGIVGTSVFARWQRVFLSAQTQFAIRSTGDFDYRFANDLTWAGGPGAYLFLREDHTLALQAVVSGEYKGKDTFQGAPAEDTGVTAVYLGPQFTYTHGEHLSAQVGVDLPVSIANTALQVVPDYRVRAAVAWHF